MLVILKYVKKKSLKFLDDVCKTGLQTSVAYKYVSDGYSVYISRRKYKDLLYVGL